MKGQSVCLVETSKALLELEAPGDGILQHLYAQGDEVELGSRVAVIAESEEELAAAEESRPAKAEPAAPAGPANATRRAVELAEEHGIDLASIEKDGFITAEDVERLVAARAAEEVAAAPGLFAGISLDGVSLPAVLELPESEGRLDESFLESLRSDPDSFRALSSDERYHAYRRAGASIGEGVRLGERTIVVAPRIVLEDGVEIGDDGDRLLRRGVRRRRADELRPSARRAAAAACSSARTATSGETSGWAAAAGAIPGRRLPWATSSSSATRRSSTPAGPS